MAIAICSCSKQYSPSLTNFSLSPHTTKSHLKVSNNISPLTHTHSSLHPSISIIVQDDALADSRTVPDRETDNFLEIEGSEVDLNRGNLCNEVSLRRRMRRRKRRGALLECAVKDKEEISSFVDKKIMGAANFMTPKEEAKFSWYLKERARIEAVRVKLQADMGGQELASSQWAKAAGISQHTLDKILCNGRESEKRITSSYQRLVISIASSYKGKGLTLQDLTQEGSIGLLRGAIKFNPEKGYKLSTYAYWWIRQAITKAIANKSRMIRLPGSIIELMPKICEANTTLSRKLKRFPTYEEIAESIDVETSVVRLALERNRSPISLDQVMTSQGYMSLQDIISGPDEVTPEEMLKKDLIKPEIQKLLTPLCEREAHIVRLHYGLNGETPWSFEDIARLYKLSRERIRQINMAALSKLRQTRGIDDLKYFV